uniref:AlNc14C78G5150 protein n=1 Tax=Albugo laibachii Nc14 TaxID=890382 RepID=F0WEV1_9STRA|nr:AlNc14C78G5150 [Albugo laibachii Nc14]|eukprot:CCA19733.1 AlNc14C78G5150 [Albugo laibachii Nc14]
MEACNIVVRKAILFQCQIIRYSETCVKLYCPKFLICLNSKSQALFLGFINKISQNQK